MLINKKNTQPLQVNCFHCQKLIIVKYVYGLKMYSHKNNWGCWTDDEKNKNIYLCDDCLVKLYRFHKWEFRKMISSKKKQARLRQYINNGTINGQAEAVFVFNKNNKDFPDKEKFSPAKKIKSSEK